MPDQESLLQELIADFDATFNSTSATRQTAQLQEQQPAMTDTNVTWSMDPYTNSYTSNEQFGIRATVYRASSECVTYRIQGPGGNVVVSDHIECRLTDDFTTDDECFDEVKRLAASSLQIRWSQSAALAEEGVDILSTDGSLVIRVPIDPVTGKPQVQGKNLRGADFSNQDVSGWDFTNCDLRASCFDNADASQARFKYARLSQSSLVDADFSESSLYGAKLEFVNVTGANFSHCDLRYSDFYGVRYADEADWSNALLSGSSGLSYCHGCMEVEPGYNLFYCSDSNEHRCESCCEYCDECDEHYAYDSDHYDYCSATMPNIHNYSWKPSPYNPKGDFRKEVLMGFELELDGPRNEMARAMKQFDPSENHIYCKEDATVSLEMVSHPFTLNWAKKNFDATAFLAQLDVAGGEDSYSAGLHVHVSRRAFSNYQDTQPIHQMAWLMFLYHNQRDMVRLSRRNYDEYAAWHKPVKGELKEKAGKAKYSDRCVAVNCNNERTYELRCFRSTLNPVELLAAFEFADASVEYTRQLRTFDILHNKGMSWKAFYTWTGKQGARYANLRKEMLRLTAVS